MPLELTASTVIVVGFLCYIAGFVSHFFMSRQEVTLEKRVAILLLISWLSFAMIAYLQNKELSLFFNAAGMGAVGNLLGIKTSEMISGLIKRK